MLRAGNRAPRRGAAVAVRAIRSAPLTLLTTSAAAASVEPAQIQRMLSATQRGGRCAVLARRLAADETLDDESRRRARTHRAHPPAGVRAAADSTPEAALAAGSAAWRARLQGAPKPPYGEIAASVPSALARVAAVSDGRAERDAALGSGMCPPAALLAFYIAGRATTVPAGGPRIEERQRGCGNGDVREQQTRTTAAMS